MKRSRTTYELRSFFISNSFSKGLPHTYHVFLTPSATVVCFWHGTPLSGHPLLTNPSSSVQGTVIPLLLHQFPQNVNCFFFTTKLRGKLSD